MRHNREFMKLGLYGDILLLATDFHNYLIPHLFRSLYLKNQATSVNFTFHEESNMRSIEN